MVLVGWSNHHFSLENLSKERTELVKLHQNFYEETVLYSILVSVFLITWLLIKYASSDTEIKSVLRRYKKKSGLIYFFQVLINSLFRIITKQNRNLLSFYTGLYRMLCSSQSDSIFFGINNISMFSLWPFLFFTEFKKWRTSGHNSGQHCAVPGREGNESYKHFKSFH